MAVVKFINGKNKKVAGLTRAIDYITDENKTEIFSFDGIDKEDIPKEQLDNEMLFVEKLMSENKGARAINYIIKDEKTSQRLITGINCSSESAFDEMMVTKRMYNKEKGRQFIHFVHSFHDKENITSELAHEISLKLLEEERFKGFEILAATHIDVDHLHTHFIINTVNSETGMKWQQSNMELEQLKKRSNELCYEYGLKYSFINTKTNEFMNRKSISSGEYRARQKGKSWKHELWLTLNECMKISTSKEDFIKMMNDLGYQVRWQDSRKDITFTLPNGRKCNSDKLHPPEKYTKGALIKRFALNKQFQERNVQFKTEQKIQNLQNLILETIRKLGINPELGDRDYPLTYLEGQALREKMIEQAKGEGLDWEKER